MNSSKEYKNLKKVVFKLSSDAHIIGLVFNVNILNTLYHNNNLFINMLNENREEKLINFFIKQREEIKKQDEREEINKFLVQYEINTNESRIILSHFIIVALYSYYERSLKSMLLKNNLCSKKECKRMYRYDYLKIFFKETLKFNYDVPGDEQFLLLEELRCLNNCIKHSGFVNDELHKANKIWKIDQEIDDLYNEVPKFIEVPCKYLKIIVDKINKIYFKD